MKTSKTVWPLSCNLQRPGSRPKTLCKKQGLGTSVGVVIKTEHHTFFEDRTHSFVSAPEKLGLMAEHINFDRKRTQGQ